MLCSLEADFARHESPDFFAAGVGRVHGTLRNWDDSDKFTLFSGLALNACGGAARGMILGSFFGQGLKVGQVSHKIVSEFALFLIQLIDFFMIGALRMVKSTVLTSFALACLCRFVLLSQSVDDLVASRKRSSIQAAGYDIS